LYEAVRLSEAYPPAAADVRETRVADSVPQRALAATNSTG